MALAHGSAHVEDKVRKERKREKSRLRLEGKTPKSLTCSQATAGNSFALPFGVASLTTPMSTIKREMTTLTTTTIMMKFTTLTSNICSERTLYWTSTRQRRDLRAPFALETAFYSSALFPQARQFIMTGECTCC